MTDEPIIDNPPDALRNAFFVVENRIRNIELGFDKLCEKQGNMYVEMNNIVNQLELLFKIYREINIKLDDVLKFINDERVNIIFDQLRKDVNDGVKAGLKKKKGLED